MFPSRMLWLLFLLWCRQAITLRFHQVKGGQSIFLRVMTTCLLLDPSGIEYSDKKLLEFEFCGSLLNNHTWYPTGRLPVQVFFGQSLQWVTYVWSLIVWENCRSVNNLELKKINPKLNFFGWLPSCVPCVDTSGHGQDHAQQVCHLLIQAEEDSSEHLSMLLRRQEGFPLLYCYMLYCNQR